MPCYYTVLMLPFSKLDHFLSRYDDGAAQRYRQRLMKMSISAGTLLFSRGDKSTDVYFIDSGTIRSVNHSANGKAVYFYTYGPGDMFGHFAGLTDGTRSADIVAETECVLWRCDAATFQEMISEHPDNALDMMRVLAGFLRKDTDRITTISGHDAAGRLLAYLKETCEAQKTDVIDVPDRDDWASYLNMTRESLSRSLNDLIKAGIIEKIGRHQVKILNKTALESQVA